VDGFPTGLLESEAKWVESILDHDGDIPLPRLNSGEDEFSASSIAKCAVSKASVISKEILDSGELNTDSLRWATEFSLNGLAELSNAISCELFDLNLDTGLQWARKLTGQRQL
jgi:hypothetical protein